MNILKRFLGLYDRKQAARTQEVADFVHVRKNAYTADMLKIHRQAKKVSEKNRQAYEESVKLKEVVDDVTRKIAVATGGMKPNI